MSKESIFFIISYSKKTPTALTYYPMWLFDLDALLNNYLGRSHWSLYFVSFFFFLLNLCFYWLRKKPQIALVPQPTIHLLSKREVGLIRLNISAVYFYFNSLFLIQLLCSVGCKDVKQIPVPDIPTWIFSLCHAKKNCILPISQREFCSARKLFIMSHNRHFILMVSI